MKKTPINEVHKKLNGRLIDFGGWELPVQYTSILEEHKAVREAAGLFDVSHMGEISVSGSDATKYINQLITNDISQMNPWQVLYSPMCYQDGGVVDDLLVYKYNDQEYLIVVNASNIEKDFNWMSDNSQSFEVQVENLSDEYAQIAIQGPKAEKILQQMTSIDLSTITFFTFKKDVKLNGTNAIVSRTGYTGEDGFEIYVKAEEGAALFETIIEVGKDQGLLPCGLGARDTLRFESALPLYGHELSKDISPVEAGLKYFIKTDKDDFNGKEVIKKQIDEKPNRLLVGFEMIDRGIARNGYKVFDENGGEIGFVTSGSFSPTLHKNLGLAIVDYNFRKKDTEIYIQVRKKMLRAKVVKKPFYSKKYKK